MDHETALINAFFVREKRDRFLTMLRNPKRRTKILGRLHHLKDLDPRYLVEISSSNQSAEKLAALLTKRGAPNLCHVIGGTNVLDGRDLPLADALDQVVNSNYGTLISCIPGRLGYFEGEELRDRYILSRPSD